MWLSCTAYRIILEEVLARWQVARVQSEACIPWTLLSPPPIFLFQKITVNHKHMYSGEETPNHAAPSLFFYTSAPSELSISPLAAPPIVCVCFVFTTTPLIRCRRRAAVVNTAEVHYTGCCCCPLPGSGLRLQSGHFFFYLPPFLGGSLQKQTRNPSCLCKKHKPGLRARVNDDRDLCKT